MRIARFLFPPLWSAALASAQVETGRAPVFTHDALACLRTDEFPVVEAVIEPAEWRALRKAQVYFKASGTDAWYFVDMEPDEGSRLKALLPKPLAETERVDYYLFFLTGSFGTSQSEQLSAPVSETSCAAIPGAVTTSPVSLTLRATVPNQPPVPPGFQPHGISGLVTTAGTTVTVGPAAAGGAASGGLSGVTVGLAVGGGAAAAAVAVTTRGEGDAPRASTDAGQGPAGGVPSTSSSTSPNPPPSPPTSSSPPPAPSLPDVSGTWQIIDTITESCDPKTVGQVSSTTMVLQQAGSVLSGSISAPMISGTVSGTIDAAGNLSLSGPVLDDGYVADLRVDGSTTTGSEMRGTFTQVYRENGCRVSGVFTGSK